MPGAGRLVVAMPTRSTVIAGRLPEAKPALGRLAQLVQQLWRQAHDGISPIVYVLGGDDLTPLRLKSGAAAAVLREGELMLAITEYEQQREHAPADGARWAPLYVAELDGRGVTVTAWAGKADELLPCAEYVKVRVDDTSAALLGMDDFLRIAGDAVRREPGVMPARWRTLTPLTESLRNAVMRQRIGLSGAAP